MLFCTYHLQAVAREGGLSYSLISIGHSFKKDFYFVLNEMPLFKLLQVSLEFTITSPHLQTGFRTLLKHLCKRIVDAKLTSKICVAKWNFTSNVHNICVYAPLPNKLAHKWPKYMLPNEILHQIVNVIAVSQKCKA